MQSGIFPKRGGEIAYDKIPHSAYLCFPPDVRATERQLLCKYIGQTLLNSSQMAPLAEELHSSFF